MYRILPTEKVCGYLRKTWKSNLFFVYLNQICFGVRLFWKQSEDLRIIHLLGNKSQSIKNLSDRKTNFEICPTLSSTKSKSYVNIFLSTWNENPELNFIQRKMFDISKCSASHVSVNSHRLKVSK